MFFKKYFYCVISLSLFLWHSNTKAESTTVANAGCETNYLLNIATKQKYCVATALENVVLATDSVPKIESDIVDISKETEFETFDSIDNMEDVQMPEIEMNQ